MRRGVLTAGQLLEDEAQAGGFRYRVAMLTLTYAPGVDWQPRHVTGCVQRIRQWLGRRAAGCRFVWVLELTAQGVPHYHVLIWLARGLTLPKPDKQGWWPHGLTRIEWARRALGYLAKYASKGTTGELPRGARLYGNGGLSAAGRAERSWRLCPAWVLERFTREDRPRRAVGGGWFSRLTGDWAPSPWRLVGHGPAWSWVALAWVGDG